MMFNVYLIQDLKASFQPHMLTFENDAMAKRWFCQLYRDSVARDPNGVYATYPEDFRLIRIGILNVDDGSFTLFEHQFIASMSNFVEV
uniref:Nonstructural protein n=1 Tax=Dulem virus 198 TaxID=3145675 RepID=A0AAU8AX15_9VIRU